MRLADFVKNDVSRFLEDTSELNLLELKTFVNLLDVVICNDEHFVKQFDRMYIYDILSIVQYKGWDEHQSIA